MLCDALQDVDEIRVDIDPVQPTGHDQRLDDADVLRSELRPAEVPVFASHWDNSQGPLEMVRIGRHAGICQEHLESCTPLPRVIQSVDGRAFRTQPVRLKRSIHPVEERLDVRLAVRQAMKSLGVPRELLLADLILDAVERCDAPQRSPSRTPSGSADSASKISRRACVQPDNGSPWDYESTTCSGCPAPNQPISGSFLAHPI